ncbi:hypothetical protein X943_003258 [Babesia divergens]|uniref:Wbp11/ELF5/Saf1 N-terminal domain-containing protein n=1 Tax=Babesia divergens TaxID=32595 RepID=A0AAD9GAQ2_BABDI|nr:hypothetical protein X943_003258 [Babesia divergens]
MTNPVQAYRKLQKKREKEKLRKNRVEVREAAKLLQEPEKLKKELDQLSHKSIIGRVDGSDALRKEKLEKLWERHEAKLNAASAHLQLSGDSTKTMSKSSSSESESDSDEEPPRCVIEIGGKALPNTKPIKRKLKDDAVGDDFALELLNNVPPLPPRPPDNHTMLQKAKSVVSIPRPPRYHIPQPILHMGMPPAPPPPPPAPVKEKNITGTLSHKEPSEVKAVPLTSYFVPNQLRLARSNNKI